MGRKFAKDVKTKESNVHDCLKVMGLNPGYLLKASLLYPNCKPCGEQLDNHSFLWVSEKKMFSEHELIFNVGK